MKYFICFVLLLFSCKGEIENKKNIVESNIKKENFSKDKIIVELTLKTNQDDLFYVNFVHSGLDNKSIVKYQQLKKSNNFQNFLVELDLTKNQVPESILLFLGQKKPKTIVIKELSFECKGTKIKGTEISNYFSPNSFVKYYKGTDSIRTIQLNNKHIPVLTMNRKTIDSLIY